MGDLSLAAQAVLGNKLEIPFSLINEWEQIKGSCASFHAAAAWGHRQGIAAALRAAADQVVPEEPLHGGDQRWMFERDARQERRKKLLAIAAELEGADQATSSTHLEVGDE